MWFNLIGESVEKLNQYTNSWEIKLSGNENVDMKIGPSGFMASSSCSVLKINGTYRKLKGVCIEGVVVTIPQGYNPQISTNNRTIKLINNNLPAPTTPLAGTTISSENVKQLIKELKAASFSSDKEEVLQNFVRDHVSSHLLVSDLSKLMESISFDSDKISALRVLLPLIGDIFGDRLEAYQAMSSILSFDSSKDEAKNILLP